MAVDLSDFVSTVRREVTPPGSTTFSTVSDDVFVGYLSDAFWEVKLDGFIEPYVCDPNGIIIPAGSSDAANIALGFQPTAFDPTVDMGRDQVALVCLYAGIKIIRNKLLEQTSRVRAKAGPVEFEQDYSANLLIEMLKELQTIRARLLFLRAEDMQVSLIDAFSARSSSPSSYSGYLYDWYMGAFGSPNSDLFFPTELGIL
jgi:hypothetical protein